jgi:glycosyltransferase involved in cell wall biosynthesis
MMIIDRRKYQFVYFLMQGLHVAAGLPVARLLNKPIIMKIAGSGEVPRIYKSRVGRQELVWLNRWAKRVLILNEGMRQEAIDHGVSEHKLAWMPNPVNTEEFSPAMPHERCQLRYDLGIPDHAQVVLYSGRLASEKGLDILLRAFALVVRQASEALLVLVGDGAMRDFLAENAKQLGLDENHIRFAGLVEPKRVCQWLKIADVFALVSPAEGFPCALAEAMSTGVASVVTDIPATRQLVENGLHGILVPLRDLERIASAIVGLLEDASLRQRMGAAARLRIQQHYSTDHIVERYEVLFRETLAQ